MLPDAPWIQEAERYGMPPYEDDPDPICPVCGKICEDIYFDRDDDPVGCERCLKRRDAVEWAWEEREKERENCLIEMEERRYEE